MQRSFQVWFYIGVLLSVYGVMLTLAGVYQWVHPPHTVLSGKHATFWSGCILLLAGSVYTIATRPKTPRDAAPAASP